MSQLSGSRRGTAEDHLPKRRRKSEAKRKGPPIEGGPVKSADHKSKRGSRPQDEFSKTSGKDGGLVPLSSDSSGLAVSSKKKRKKQIHEHSEDGILPSTLGLSVTASEDGPSNGNLTDFQAKMQNSLHGARFRYLFHLLC